MSTDKSMRALRDASPRNQPGFEEWIERLDRLREEIPTTPVPARRRPRPASRRRMIGLSAAAAVVLATAAVVVALALRAASPPSAYAAAKEAVAVTAAASSGTITGTVRHDGSSYTLDTTRWHGTAIEVTRGDRSQLARNQALLLIDGGAYLQLPNRSWLHYSSAAGVGVKLGPQVELAHNNVNGNTASQILSLAKRLTRTTQPNGGTVYTGSIPSTNSDPGTPPSDDTILRIITNLRGGNDAVGPHKVVPPAGFHDGLKLRMTVGSDGFIRQVSVTYQQQNTGSPAADGLYTWTIAYSQLGSTPPISAPATSTPWSSPLPRTSTKASD